MSMSVDQQCQGQKPRANCEQHAVDQPNVWVGYNLEHRLPVPLPTEHMIERHAREGCKKARNNPGCGLVVEEGCIPGYQRERANYSRGDQELVRQGIGIILASARRVEVLSRG